MHLTLLLACRVLPGAGAAAFCDSEGPGDSSSCCGIQTLALGMCRCAPRSESAGWLSRAHTRRLHAGHVAPVRGSLPLGEAGRLWAQACPSAPSRDCVLPSDTEPRGLALRCARHMWRPSGCRDPSAAVIGLDDRGWFQFPRTRIPQVSCSPVSAVKVRGEPQGAASTLMG